MLMLGFVSARRQLQQVGVFAIQYPRRASVPVIPDSYGDHLTQSIVVFHADVCRRLRLVQTPVALVRFTLPSNSCAPH